MSEVYKEDVDIDFEIRFLEGLLKHQPDFVEALMMLGDNYTKRGLYRKGLDVDEKLARLCPEDPVVFYNLACSYSLVKDIDRALTAIKKAIGLGYHHFSHLETDPDFANLRADVRFQDYYERLKKNLAAAAKDMADAEDVQEFVEGTDEVVS